MMRITRKRAKGVPSAAIGVWMAVCLPVSALELTLPSNARETASETVAADTYDLPIEGWKADIGVPVASLQGQVVRKAWRIPGASQTTGQVLGPLRDQLMQAGFDIIFECTARSCGGFDFRFNTDVIKAPAMYVDLSDFRFLSAKGPDASRALSLLVSRDGDSLFVQLIEVGPERRTPVTISSVSTTNEVAIGDIVSQLEAVGHVVLADLDFASGSASLGNGPTESLDALVAYLTTNPTRQITFVGHTDATGSLAANISLSKRRADAARAYVVARGVPQNQVASDGVGFLSPRASNLTSEGREANRRVEAVLISTE